MSMGLSPRTRGKQVAGRDIRFCLGPIPANAGETIRATTMLIAMRAYPRERGGNMMQAELTNIIQGLSPRTRGKLMP